MAKALIVYATRSGETKKIADLIAEGMRMGGLFEVDLKNVTEIKGAEDLAGYDGLVLGSATYHGDMIGTMKTCLFLAEKAGLKGKVGGAYGAFGWSGEAPQRIFDTLKHIMEMDMVGDCLRLKSSTLDGGMQMAQDYGREVAKKVLGE
jgi:flavorubredoxin